MVVAALAVAPVACSGDDGGSVDRADSESTATSPSSSDSGGSSGDDSEPTRDLVEVRFGLERVRTIDPVAISPASVGDLLVADLFYDTLTVLDDEDGLAVPSLATFTSNEDRTVWRFEVLDGATFADGTAITADDVVFSLERIRGQGGASLAAVRLDDVDTITAVGPRHVDISLHRPSAVLPEILSSPLYPITDQDAIGVSTGGGDQTPNASGDYEVTIEGGTRFVLERRRDDAAVPERVTVDLYETVEHAFDDFVAGSLDWSPVPPDRLGEALDLAGDDGLVPFQGGLFLGVNTSVPPLDDERLRRAIALSIDRRAVVNGVFGITAQPLQGIVPDGVPGDAWDAGECRGPCGPDTDEAKRLVDEVFGDAEPPTMRMLVDDSDSQRGVGSVLEDQLERSGLDIDVSPLEVSAYETLVTSGQQPLYLFGWLGVARTPQQWLAPLFFSTSDDNLTGFADDAVDFMLEVARTDPDPGTRAVVFADAEAAVLARVPVVPLVQFRTVAAISERISGLRIRADGTVDLSG